MTSHTALRQYPTPHRVKSSDQVIFPFYLIFPDESLCFVLLLIFFLILSLIHHAVLKNELSGIFL